MEENWVKLHSARTLLVKLMATLLCKTIAQAEMFNCSFRNLSGIMGSWYIPTPRYLQMQPIALCCMPCIVSVCNAMQRGGAGQGLRYGARSGDFLNNVTHHRSNLSARPLFIRGIKLYPGCSRAPPPLAPLPPRGRDLLPSVGSPSPRHPAAIVAGPRGELSYIQPFSRQITSQI
jgi:hypothetical protein